MICRKSLSHNTRCAATRIIASLTIGSYLPTRISSAVFPNTSNNPANLPHPRSNNTSVAAPNCVNNVARARCGAIGLQLHSLRKSIETAYFLAPT